MKTIIDENENTYIIGQNKNENWEMLDTNGNFTWLHLNSFPSCYVIIEDENASQDMIEFGAKLCKENTKYRNVPNLKICYTTCNNLKKGNEVGSVTFKSNRKRKTITI
tara:strand:+ start:1605 stop:1928 length:324 start_codon:yes stop_codon:yes gene_type:complete